jgi:hypothetical protein
LHCSAHEEKGERRRRIKLCKMGNPYELEEYNLLNIGCG